MWLLAFMALFAEPTLSDSGLKTPEALHSKWSEVKEQAVQKYERIKQSETGAKVRTKAVEAKNSYFVKNIFVKAEEMWKAALVRGKGLLSRVDRQLHERVLDRP